MAFTAPAATPRLSTQLVTIVTELIVAYRERYQVLRSRDEWPEDPLPYEDFLVDPRRISTDGRNFINGLRNDITGLLARSNPPAPLRGFLASDLTLTNIDDVLEAAGYPDGWITDNLRISNHLIWKQFQDVLPLIVKYAYGWSDSFETSLLAAEYQLEVV